MQSIAKAPSFVIPTIPDQMGAANKVDLMKKFLKIQMECSATLTEFMGRFDYEDYNMKFQGVEVPEELMLCILQQSIGDKHETYMRILM